jgi:hypothetical protein
VLDKFIFLGHLAGEKTAKHYLAFASPERLVIEGLIVNVPSFCISPYHKASLLLATKERHPPSNLIQK